MNGQNFDLGWEYTETTGMMAMAFAEWQPVNLPHDLSIAKARSQSHLTGSGGYAWSGGELIAPGTPNPIAEELYVGNRRKAWQGRLMAVVRSNGQSGEIMLRTSANGLAGAEIQLKACNES